MKKAVRVGNVVIGGDAPVSIQSMTNTDTADTRTTGEQIRALYDAGCDIVRVSVYNEACAGAVRRLVDESPVPLVADIHFDHRLAIAAIENGISKLRLNPGNMTGEDKVRMVADCAKKHGTPIRIGVNSGSVPRDILDRDGGVTAEGLVDAAARHARLLEQNGFDDIVISIKSSDVATMVKACRLADRVLGYPLHLGVTEAGLPGQGTIKSAIGVGALLLDGIGNTIRVSLSGSPIPEAAAAIAILKALNLRPGIRLVSCPTCGRTQIDVAGIAAQIEEKTRHITRPLKVAVMGCVVNGPGEAKEADIALCGGRDSGAMYVKGKFVKRLTGDYAEELLHAIDVYKDAEDKS